MSGALGVLLLTAAVAQPKPIWPVAFGGPDTGWVVMSRAGDVLQRFEKLGGYAPLNVAVSPDGLRFAFTASDPERSNTSLFLMDEKRQLVRIGGGSGYHAWPSWSSDGKWIVFSHNPSKGGPPGAHGLNEYAQIYRQRPDGTGLQALTSSRGCHLAPATHDGQRIINSHSGCEGDERGLEQFSAPAKGLIKSEARLTPLESGDAEPSFSTDGKNIIFARTNRNTVQLMVSPVAAFKPKAIATVERQGRTHRPVFASQRGEFLFRNGDAIFRADEKGQVSKVTTIRAQQ